MTKIDIISGFLGAGKTTLINRLIKEAYSGEKVVLIENEFGEIGIDGGFLKDAGIEITEMNSGCICCSLVGDFSEALNKVVKEYAPDRILIEPSGVGKLSDVTKAVVDAEIDNAVLNSATVVVDVNKCKLYMKNFGEFFNNQIENAGCIVFSHTDKTTDAKLTESLTLVRAHNDKATVVTTPANQLDIATLISAIENKDTVSALKESLIEEEECPICHPHHHEHHHDRDEHHEEHHHHDHDEHHEEYHHHDHDECHEEHHHHDHDECHDEHHHHDRDECHEEHHHHDHLHHADEVFTSWGTETLKKYSEDDIKNILKALEDSDKYGLILRAKGIVASDSNEWIYFDYVPEEPDVRTGSTATIGKLCVIGSKINEHEIEHLFGIKE